MAKINERDLTRARIDGAIVGLLLGGLAEFFFLVGPFIVGVLLLLAFLVVVFFLSWPKKK
jgi:uncharacterized membrane protein